jgi:undecaprenyl-phosphate 4-deoxy-4-formamido-L-arabinose transferase
MDEDKMVSGISVIIPVYNGQESLAELVARLDVVLKALGNENELLLVNDGSADRSWEVISGLASQHRWIRGIDLMRNYGQHNALLIGIRNARFDVIVTMDDDLQNPPEEIPKLLGKLSEEYDVVYGTPQTEQHGFWRDMASRISKLAFQATMGVETARNVSAFRAFKTNLREAFANYQSPFVSIDVLLTWGTKRFTSVYVRHDQRLAGVSNYTFRMLVTHALNMMTGFSTLPLQLASLVGFGCTLFGVGVLIFVLARYVVEGGSIPGFPFLASVISIFAGAQLFTIGIIGEYLSRMHFRTMGRPYAVIRGTAGNFSNDKGNPS